MEMRPTSSVRRNWLSPRFGSPMSCSSGTQTSSKYSSRVSSPRQPMPRIFGPMVKPGVSFSTTKLANLGARALGGLGAGQQRHPERHVGPGVGDERLATVDEPAAVAPLGPGADAAGVGAGVRLGEPEGAEHPSLGQRAQPALALGVVAEQVQRQRADGHVGLPRRGHRLVGQADLLHGGDEADGRHADPAPLLGNEHAEQAELAHLAEQIGRAPGLLPGQRRPRGDLLLGEVAAEADQVLFRFAEREVHAAFRSLLGLEVGHEGGRPVRRSAGRSSPARR